MPTSYITPPWLSPNAIAPFEQAYQTGVRTGHQRAQIALQAQHQAQQQLERQIEFQARQEAQDRAEERRITELAIDAAYKQSMIGLQQQRIQKQAEKEQAAIERQQAKIQQAANQAAAQMRVAKAVREGQDPMRALMAEAENLGMGGASFANLFRSNPAKAPSTLSEVTFGGRRFVQATNPNTGHVSLHPLEPFTNPNWERNAQLHEWQRERDQLRLDLSPRLRGELTPEQITAKESKLKEYNAKIQGLISGSPSGATTTNTPSTGGTIKFGPGMSHDDMVKEIEAFRAPERGGAAEEGQMEEGEGVMPEYATQPEAANEDDFEVLSDEDINAMLGIENYEDTGEGTGEE